MRESWNYTQRISAPANKLRLFDSPLVDQSVLYDRDEWAQPPSSSTHASKPSPQPNHPKNREDIPQFKRYQEPTLLELFLDLFFAANYDVFGETQRVTNHDRFKAYVGYFCLLWLTWFVVALFDVRYVTDSILARVMRAVHLGVLVGFTVVSAKFDTTNQDAHTMRTMCIILGVSRFALAIDYSCTAWHLRRFKKAHVPLLIQIAIHVMAAAIFTGIAFRFRQGERTHVFMVWYFVAGSEAVASLLLSNVSPILNLAETHLMKRLILMTVMIMGNGVSEVAKKVVIIVKNSHAWDATTIGQIVAAVVVIYFVFLVYFDWLRSCVHLPPLQQEIWTALHFPFNLALVLFLQAIQQYVIWGKITTQLNRALDIAYPLDDPNIINDSSTSASVAAALNASAVDFLLDYPPRITSTWDTINDAIRNVSQVPDSFWPEFRRLILGSSVKDIADELDKLPSDAMYSLQIVLTSTLTLGATMANALFGVFGIDVDGDIVKKNPNAAKAVKGGGFQFQVQDKAWSLYRLVFAYGYVACGCTIVLMVILNTLVRSRCYTRWQIIRLVGVVALGLGVALTSTLWYNYDRAQAFLAHALALPTLAIVWTAILVITHLNGQNVRWCANHLRRMRKSLSRSALGRGDHSEVHNAKRDDTEVNVERRHPAFDHFAERLQETNVSGSGISFNGYEEKRLIFRGRAFSV